MFRNVLLSFILVLAIASSVWAYGSWGTSSTEELDEIIHGLDEIIQRAAQANAAYPGFLRDLQSSLEELKSYRDSLGSTRQPQPQTSSVQVPLNEFYRVRTDPSRFDWSSLSQSIHDPITFISRVGTREDYTEISNRTLSRAEFLEARQELAERHRRDPELAGAWGHQSHSWIDYQESISGNMATVIGTVRITKMQEGETHYEVEEITAELHKRDGVWQLRRHINYLETAPF